MFASLSIYGLFTHDNSIFDNLHLPVGMDADIVKTSILTECSDFCLLYPNWEFMKMLIGVWSSKELSIWTNLWNSEHLDYNPLDNYDRHESISRAVSSREAGQSESASASADNSASENVGAKTSYDSNTFKDVGKESSKGSNSSTGTARGTSENESSGTETVTTHAHGNIGVTTAAQLIQGYRDISEFCTYDYIVQSFKDRFCIQVF